MVFADGYELTANISEGATYNSNAQAGTCWTVQPILSNGGSQTANYLLTFKSGTLTMISENSVTRDVPTPIGTSFTYDGKSHRAVSEADWYTLSGDVEMTNACSIRTENGVPVTGKDRYQKYTTTISLKNTDDYWSDGSKESKTIEWQITKRPLSLKFQESWVGKGNTSVPNNTKVTGFASGQSENTLPGFKLPNLRWSNDPISEDGTPLSESVGRLVSTAGDYRLIPDPFYNASTNPYDPTSNYEFTLYDGGTLHVCTLIDVPSGKTLVYNGSRQTGIASGTEYSIVSGTSSQTNVGTYTAGVVPTYNYMWKKNGGTRDTHSVTWKIAAASLSTASISSIGAQQYTGFFITPKPTVQWNKRTLKEGTDYTLSYANNRNAGTATVTVKGKGNYTGSKSTTFVITKPAQASVPASDPTPVPLQTPTPAPVVIPPASITYRAHGQSYGWQGWVGAGAVAGTTGRAKRLEAVQLSLSGAPYAGGVTYRVHGQTYGWQGWVADGRVAGTTGRSKRIEAVEISLTGEMAERYDVWYRVHAESFGWMGWTRNGGRAGSTSLSKRLEALQVVVLPKGSAAPGDTTRPYVGRQVRVRAHCQTYGWRDWAYDGQTAGSTGQSKRLEAFAVALSDQPCAGGVRYRAHGQSYGWQGWVADGQVAGTTGQSKRVEAVQVELYGEMAERYDVWYRAHAAGFGWMGWTCNGGVAGTTGQSRRLEAVQVMILPKGSAAPGSTSGASR